MPNTIIRIEIFESSPLQQRTCTAEEPTGDSLSIQPVIIDNYRFWGIVFVSDISYNQIISQNISSLMCKHCQRNSPRVKCSKQVCSLDPNENTKKLKQANLRFQQKIFHTVGKSWKAVVKLLPNLASYCQVFSCDQPIVYPLFSVNISKFLDGIFNSRSHINQFY